MTDMVNAATGAKRKGKGLTMTRLYTTPGVHPYDEVTWEPRDVVQTNWKTGETVFEQRGVDFPDFWSINASTIVTTKYFRGAVGTPKRENSLRQLIDRYGPEHVLLGTDYPYDMGEDDPRGLLAEVKRLSAKDRKLIEGGNAARLDRKSTRLNSSHTDISRMPSSA